MCPLQNKFLKRVPVANIHFCNRHITGRIGSGISCQSPASDNTIQVALEKTVEDLQIELQELGKVIDEREKLGGLTWPFDMNISF